MSSEGMVPTLRATERFLRKAARPGGYDVGPWSTLRRGRYVAVVLFCGDGPSVHRRIPTAALVPINGWARELADAVASMRAEALAQWQERLRRRANRAVTLDLGQQRL